MREGDGSPQHLTRRMSECRRMYERRFAGASDYRDRVWQVLCGRFFSRWIAPDDVVLDLGAGWGEFINNIRCGERHAMDLNPHTAERLAPAIDFHLQDCSERWHLADDSLDVVFTSNFLEHLPTKTHISRTLAEASRCLRAGGRIICMGPNIRLLPGAYWDFYDHYLPLTERSVGEALELNGFEIERCHPAFLPYTMTGNQPPLVLLHLYLRLPFFWRFFGRQFLVVGRKMGSGGAIS